MLYINNEGGELCPVDSQNYSKLAQATDVEAVSP